MTTELTILACVVAFGLSQVVLAAQLSNRQRGYIWAAGPRDNGTPELSGIAGRVDRAVRNFFETFPLFATAILLAHAAGRHSWMTMLGAHLYLWARVLYLPLYAAGVFLIRSLVWNIGFLGIILVLLGVL